MQNKLVPPPPEFLNLLEGADLSARADSLCSSPVKPREMCDIFIGVKSLDYLGFLLVFFFLPNVSVFYSKNITE